MVAVITVLHKIWVIRMVCHITQVLQQAQELRSVWGLNIVTLRVCGTMFGIGVMVVIMIAMV